MEKTEKDMEDTQRQYIPQQTGRNNKKAEVKQGGTGNAESGIKGSPGRTGSFT